MLKYFDDKILLGIFASDKKCLFICLLFLMELVVNVLGVENVLN